MLQAYVTVSEPPEKAAAHPFQGAGAKDGATLQGFETVGGRGWSAPRWLLVRGSPGRTARSSSYPRGPELLCRWTFSLPVIRMSRWDLGFPTAGVQQHRGAFLLHILRDCGTGGWSLTLHNWRHRQNRLLKLASDFLRGWMFWLRGRISHPQSGATSKLVPPKLRPLVLHVPAHVSPAQLPAAFMGGNVGVPL